ncbi:hypothetical protein B7463_g1975, partial [Scytalidium lignicola]
MSSVRLWKTVTKRDITIDWLRWFLSDKMSQPMASEIVKRRGFPVQVSSLLPALSSWVEQLALFQILGAIVHSSVLEINMGAGYG